VSVGSIVVHLDVFEHRRVCARVAKGSPWISSTFKVWKKLSAQALP